MFSPEYANAPDTSFDNVLFRWCLTTALHIATELLPKTSNTTAAEIALWREMLQVSMRTFPEFHIDHAEETWNRSMFCWKTHVHLLEQDLTPPAIDPATGSLMIGAGVPFHSANKHFSHLFSIFPLGLL